VPCGSQATAPQSGGFPADAVLPWAGCAPWAYAGEYFRFPFYPFDWEKTQITKSSPRYRMVSLLAFRRNPVLFLIWGVVLFPEIPGGRQSIRVSWTEIIQSKQGKRSPNPPIFFETRESRGKIPRDSPAEAPVPVQAFFAVEREKEVRWQPKSNPG